MQAKISLSRKIRRFSPPPRPERAKRRRAYSLKDATKTGYLAKQDFLKRSDVRAFELEKDDRNAQRAKMAEE